MTPTKKPIVILGIFVADTAYRADRQPKMGETILGHSFVLGPGGKGSNQSVAAAMAGGNVHIITRLGNDAFADIARATWAKAGVKPEVKVDAESYTGAAYIFIEQATGNNAIIVAAGAAGRVSTQDVEAKADLIESAAIFVTQLEQPIAATLRGLQIARAAGVTTILNPAPAATLPDSMLALCDFLTPYHDSTQSVHVPVVSAGAVVETTGAGDAFNGGFAVALSEGRNVIEAVRFGCATAGISVTRPGTAPAMPSRNEIDALLAR
jgi:ribokinase